MLSQIINFIPTIVSFIITLALLVLVHELGHFLVAKKFNVKVLEFGFGLPPRAWGKKWGETLVSLNWLPIGGFVRLLGEDETDKSKLDDKRSLAAQPPLKKMAIVTAGVTMNLILAFILFWIILAAQNFKITLPPSNIDYQFVGATQTKEDTVFIGLVAQNSPAKHAGIKVGDRIIALDGQPINNVNSLIETIKNKAGKEITLDLSNVQKTQFKKVTVTPRQNPPQGEGPLGIAPGGFTQITVEYKTPLQKLFSGPIHSYNLAILSFQALGQTLSKAIVSKDPEAIPVTGLVGMVAIQDAVIKGENKFLSSLEFMALLSLSLAIFNILPIPALDGGRLIFYLFEALTGKKSNAFIEKYTHAFGMALLLTLLFFVTYLDIKRFILPLFDKFF